MRYLSILEVSQKQAYIFASNKLKDNIINSAVIAYALCPEYINKVLNGESYSDEKNMVYSGGGHTILEFEDKYIAVKCISIITESIYRNFGGLEVFAKIIPYDDNITVQEKLNKLKNLTKELEVKKSRRISSFKHGSYGIEDIDVNTLDIKLNDKSKDTSLKKEVKEKEKTESENVFTPNGFKTTYKFEDLGSNFIAVVHIDGNGMGKRVNDLYSILGKDNQNDWNGIKFKLRDFSEQIDKHFKLAYTEMTESVAESIKNGELKDKFKLNKNYFPIRRIITAGDDICFVADGKIGIECARIFIEKLAKRKNTVDDKSYTACAGVAIVHKKYPFYRAYELAELLCSNAKSYGATISQGDNGSSVSLIDWHIEYGELKDSLKEIRSNYKTNDDCNLELRPYIINGPKDILNNKDFYAKKYTYFMKVIDNLQNKESKYGDGKIKQLRLALKKGETETKNYLVFNQMQDILIENMPNSESISDEDIIKIKNGKKTESTAFIELNSDKRKHSLLFDSIELVDIFMKI